MQKVVIVGAGLVGTAAALILEKRGFEITLLEKRPDPAISGMESGRSVNLALSARGIATLKKLGLDQKVLSRAVPMSGRMLHSEPGETTKVPYGREGQCIHSISRSALNLLLLDEVKKHSSIDLKFQHQFSKYDDSTIHFLDGEEAKSIHCDALIAADGGFSAVRKSIFSDHQLHEVSYDYIEIDIPAQNGKHRLEPDALHIWPRKEYMLIALPNYDGSLTATFFAPETGPLALKKALTEGKEFFSTHFPDLIPLVPDLEDQLQNAKISSLFWLDAKTWTQDKTLLIGDAAHAIVPFFGQGMNCGLQDCQVLDELLDQFDNDLEESFISFANQRKPEGDAISRLSLHNFVEMRDGVASEDFADKKAMELFLETQFGDDFEPMYSQVTFSSGSYCKAEKDGLAHDKLVEELLALAPEQKKWPEWIKEETPQTILAKYSIIK